MKYKAIYRRILKLFCVVVIAPPLAIIVGWWMRSSKESFTIHNIEHLWFLNLVLGIIGGGLGGFVAFFVGWIICMYIISIIDYIYKWIKTGKWKWIDPWKVEE